MKRTSTMRQPQSVETVHAGPVKVTRGLWKVFFRELVGIVLFNTVIALILFFIGFGGTFFQNFVFSQCIGISITVFIDGGRRAIWRDGAPSMVPFLLLVAFGCAAGLALGIALGTALLGLPISMWQPLNGHSLPIALLIALLATCVGTYHGWSRARLSQLREATAQQALREAAAEKALVHAQLQTLQAQLEPHFLFNVLANLDSLIASDPVRARTLLGHLNRFLRASLAATRADVTTVADEFALLEALMSIQQVRFGERLRYTFDLPEDCRTLQVPPMLVQPLVENAVKHGVEPLAGGASVDVSARRERTADGAWQLVLRVADDGAGFRDVARGNPHEHLGGVGLTNIRERLRVLYGDTARLTLSEGVPRGVVATLRLPVALSGPQMSPTA
ncbi:sensor histidine kinase [Pandoraea apista]|uniref:Sensor histidine kinase n=1 Tax=Pandoraea apista TaxID=93218 RepID=A0ABX9ZRJ1_9BURK|nr:sensor histidine kinase [Pandoraea apista]RRJ27836.1 sensor histidine kinase [Pandoraea apista]RRJ79475.1 sensor histidine kinase [Pandoraea apista]RSD15208.1 sensor histidine kinase [Pandoraea apista]RSD22461.1 sensor histidine kinase [Pandoraea apista]